MNLESIIKDTVTKSVNVAKNGVLKLVTSVCDKFDLEKIIDDAIDNSNGRKPEISYGRLAKMFVGSICDQHTPLYLMPEYFADKDVKGLFDVDDVSKLNDQRFGLLLDRLSEINLKKLFSTLSIAAYKEFGIAIKNINYDTTSKVMWGEYSTPDNNIAKLDITFGHSKQKRNDKKQLKIGIGTANGFVIDAKVLDGNEDDKTYNKENIEDAKELVNQIDIGNEDFHYVADSALFTKPTLDKLNNGNNKMLFITRAPNNINKIKELKKTILTDKDKFEDIVIKNSHEKTLNYKINECIDEYEGHECKFAVCFSEALIATKTRSINNKVEKEHKDIMKFIKAYKKKAFSSNEKAELEITDIKEKQFTNFKYHEITVRTQKVDRKQLKPRNKELEALNYMLEFEVSKKEESIKNLIEYESTFVLATNDMKLTGKEILKEYKTQSEVEQKFKALKSPLFMNSLFLKKAERVESMVYLILIALMVSSIMEYKVREYLKKNEESIIGPGRIRMRNVTLRSIYRLFENIYSCIVTTDYNIVSVLKDDLSEAQRTILKALGIKEEIFVINSYST